MMPDDGTLAGAHSGGRRIVSLNNSWIIMNPGGPPTPDKPGITVVDY